MHDVPRGDAELRDCAAHALDCLSGAMRRIQGGLFESAAFQAALADAWIDWPLRPVGPGTPEAP